MKKAIMLRSILVAGGGLSVYGLMLWLQELFVFMVIFSALAVVALSPWLDRFSNGQG